MESILLIRVPKNTGHHNCFSKLIITLKSVTYGRSDASLLIFSKTRPYFIVSRRLIWKFWEEYSG